MHREGLHLDQGCTYELLPVLLDDADTFKLLFEALSVFAKPDGGVRDIAIVSSLRRLVARTLAKQFAKEFEIMCAFPVRFVHQGWDGLCRQTEVGPPPSSVSTALAHLITFSVLAMFERLEKMLAARSILSFVRFVGRHSVQVQLVGRGRSETHLHSSQGR